MKLARAVFLDLDSTLLDNRGYSETLRATCAELAASCPEIDAEALFRADTEVFRLSEVLGPAP